MCFIWNIIFFDYFLTLANESDILGMNKKITGLRLDWRSELSRSNCNVDDCSHHVLPAVFYRQYNTVRTGLTSPLQFAKGVFDVKIILFHTKIIPMAERGYRNNT